MRRIWLVALAVALAGCALKPSFKSARIENPVMLNIAYDDAWKKSLEILDDKGFTVIHADKQSGTISTSVRRVKLDETEADCGTLKGVPYLGDKRTVASAAYSLLLKSYEANQTGITVNTFIDAVYNPTSKHLSCTSLGYLEMDFIADLK